MTKIDYHQRILSAEIDWDRVTNSDISRVFTSGRMRAPAIHAIRIELGKPPCLSRYQGAACRIVWREVDWSKTDAQLGRELKCTRERVRQVRKELELPPSNGQGWGKKPSKHSKPPPI